MLTSVGIGLAFVAMLSWGIGDFLIQRSVRRLGDFETLFIITTFGGLVLFPFVWDDIPGLFSFQAKDILFILFTTGFFLLTASLLQFEALKRGKLSVVEPIWSLEIIAATLLSFFFLKESLTALQIILIVSLMLGLMMVSFKGRVISFKWFLEKGIFISLFAAFFMGVANFFVGWGSRVSDPLMTNFFVNVFIAVISGAYLVCSGRAGRVIRDAISSRVLLLPTAIADNTAWIAFAFAMSLAPIGVVVALSESYIIVAVLLGLSINHEKLEKHQKVGLLVALIAIMWLVAITR